MKNISKILTTLVVLASVILTPIDNNGDTIIKHATAKEADNNVEVDRSNSKENNVFDIHSMVALEVPVESRILTVNTSEKNEEVEPQNTYYKVQAFALNKRKTPSLDHSPIGYLGSNEPVKGIKTLDNGWVELSDGSYVNGKYLTTVEMTEEEYLTAIEEYKAYKAKVAEELRQKKIEEQKRAAEQQTKVAQGTSHIVSVANVSSSVGRNGISLSSSDRDLLARLVRAEAGGESYEGMVAVASVVLNRVFSSKFPDTIQGVIYARNQFSPVANGSINKPASDVHYKAVDDALRRDNTNGATFFYAPAVVDSAYMESLQTVAVIGGHHFKVN